MTNADTRPRLITQRTINQIIGTNVHHLMWHVKETQKGLAPVLGITQSALSHKLRGSRPWFAHEIEEVVSRYGFLGITRDHLFTKLPDLGGPHDPSSRPRESNSGPSHYNRQTSPFASLNTSIKLAA